MLALETEEESLCCQDKNEIPENYLEVHTFQLLFYVNTRF